MYSIDDNDGNLIATGIDERIALMVAQDLADQIGAPVWIYQSPNCVTVPVTPSEAK